MGDGRGRHGKIGGESLCLRALAQASANRGGPGTARAVVGGGGGVNGSVLAGEGRSGIQAS